jgi:DNA repair protein RadC
VSKKKLFITSSPQAHKLIKDKISYSKEETWTLSLNTLKQPLALNRHFVGTLDSCPFHPRDIFRVLLRQNAHSFLLYHSHPSGNSEPSSQDLLITESLIKASEFMHIELIDHIIVTKEDYFSFKDNRLLF